MVGLQFSRNKTFIVGFVFTNENDVLFFVYTSLYNSRMLFVIQNISNIITDRLSDLCDLRFNIMKIVRGLSITN